MTWLGAFALTQLIETPIYAYALRGLPARWAWAFGASCLTHPFIYFVLPTLWPSDPLNYVLQAEAVAVGFEAIYLAALRTRPAVLWALSANGASVAVGLASRHLFGWP